MLSATTDARIHHAVDQIYAAAAAPSLWPAALDAIAHCTDDVGTVLIYQRDDGGFGTIASHGLARAQEDYAAREWWRQDIRFARHVERSYLVNRNSVTERHLGRPEELQGHPFYADFLASHGLKWFAGVGLSPDPHVAVALSVQRAATRPEYSDDELAVVERLGRHVENALRLGIRLIDAEVRAATFADIMGRQRAGVFTVDRNARILFQNERARDLLGTALISSHGRLTARFAPERDALQAALRSAAETDPAAAAEPGKPILVRGEDGDRLLAIYVFPMRTAADDVAQRMFGSARAAVVITEWKAGEPADPAAVRDLLGLTLSEARIAALVGAGLAPRDAGARLGISEETARSTLKRVFAKLGLARQSELSMMLTRLVLK